MKTATIRNFAILFCVVAFTALSSAKAEKIAILDLENVLKNSDAMKYAQKKISSRQSDYQKEINKKQSSLENEGKKINSKRNVLSKEAFAKEQEKFAVKLEELKEFVDSKQESLKKASLKAVSKINDKLEDVIEDVREEKNIDIIISASSTVFYKESLDISSDVLKRLNKKITKVSVSF
jgi:outer membrane protein